MAESFLIEDPRTTANVAQIWSSPSPMIIPFVQTSSDPFSIEALLSLLLLFSSMSPAIIDTQF
jgi:hypothetical protein